MTTRAATTADLPAIADIYAHYVLNSVASFELEPPAADDWQARFAKVTAAGLPFLVVEREVKVAGNGRLRSRLIAAWISPADWDRSLRCRTTRLARRAMVAGMLNSR